MSFNELPKSLDDIYGPGSEEADAMADRDAEILDQAIKNVGDSKDTEQVVFEALRLERENPWKRFREEEQSKKLYKAYILNALLQKYNDEDGPDLTEIIESTIQIANKMVFAENKEI